MERERWQRVVTVLLVVNVLLALVAIGLGIAALGRTSGSSGSPGGTVAAGPVTSFVTPVNGATLSANVGLGAKPLGPGVVAVDFLATGGSLHDAKIGTGAVSRVGWLAAWDTRTVPNGTYTLAAVSYDAQGQSGRSAGVVVTVKN